MFFLMKSGNPERGSWNRSCHAIQDDELLLAGWFDIHYYIHWNSLDVLYVLLVDVLLSFARVPSEFSCWMCGYHLKIPWLKMDGHSQIQRIIMHHISMNFNGLIKNILKQCKTYINTHRYIYIYWCIRFWCDIPHETTGHFRIFGARNAGPQDAASLRGHASLEAVQRSGSQLNRFLVPLRFNGGWMVVEWCLMVV